jgi:hypothetical protein
MIDGKVRLGPHPDRRAERMRVIHGKRHNIASVKPDRREGAVGQLGPARPFDKRVKKEHILRDRHDRHRNR